MNGPTARRAGAIAALTFVTFVVAMAAASIIGLTVSAACEWLHGDAAPNWPTRPGAVRELLADLGRVLVDACAGNPPELGLVGATAALSLMVALLPAPALGGQPSIEGPGRSLRLSVAGAAAIGGLLGVGGFALLVDLAFMAIMADADEAARNGWRDLRIRALHPAVLLAAWAVSGGAWAFAIARAGRPGDLTRVDRWVRWLFAGTAVESAIAVPTLAFGARRESCYCSLCSWWVLIAGTTMLVLLCGPAIILLRTREARMRWMRGACTGCGYPRRGASGVCPECGEVMEELYAGLLSNGKWVAPRCKWCATEKQ